MNAATTCYDRCPPVTSSTIARTVMSAWLAFLLSLLTWRAFSPTTAHAQATPPTQLTEILANGHSSDPTAFVELNGVLLFAAYNGEARQLWRSDGTSAGTMALATVQERPHEFFVIDGQAYFSLYNGSADRYDIWKTDGTVDGTALRATLPSGASNTGTSNTVASVKLFAFEKGLLIVINDTIWRISDRNNPDATPHHVYTFEDWAVGGYGMTEGYVISNEGNGNALLYFGARVAGDDWGLWQSDGTTAGTTLIVGDFSGITVPMRLDDQLLFTAQTEATGWGLWSSDGTTAGTTLIVGDFSGITVPMRFDDQLLFTAQTEATGWELWSSDGTAAGTALLKEINPGPADSFPALLPKLNEHFLYFTARNVAHELALWRTDGTPAGTTLVHDAMPDTEQSGAMEFFTFQDQAYVLLNSRELWELLPGDPGMRQVATLPVVVAEIMQVTTDAIFFLSEEDNFTYSFWKMDGTAAGTTLLVKNMVHSPPWGPLTWPPSALQIGDRVYWGILYDEHGTELWLSDPRFEEVTLVQDINPIVMGPSFREHTIFAGKFYSSWRGLFTDSLQLIESNGTVTGTRIVDGLVFDSLPVFQNDEEVLYFSRDGEIWRTTDPGNNATQVTTFGDDLRLRAFVVAANKLYATTFRNSDGKRELWVGDKRATGMQRIAEWDGQFLFLANLHTTGDRLFFEVATYPPEPEHELWTSDGTEGGTQFLANGVIEAMWPFGDKMLVQLITAERGPALLISDGTVAGTHTVHDDLADVMDAGVTVVGRFSTHFLFTTYHPDGPVMLWRSVGSTVGTVALTELPQPANRWEIQQLTTVDDVTFFAIDQLEEDGSRNLRLVRSDGTAEGTWVINDERSGVTISRQAARIQSAYLDGILYLLPAPGAQLWRTDGTHVGTAPVASLYPTFDLTAITDVTAYDGQLILVADSGAKGQQLWRYQPGAIEVEPAVYLPLIAAQE